MTCTNCFSGCVETTSDKCVKYTGNPIGFLGINTGDTLESIEKAITVLQEDSQVNYDVLL